MQRTLRLCSPRAPATHRLQLCVTALLGRRHQLRWHAAPPSETSAAAGCCRRRGGSSVALPSCGSNTAGSPCRCSCRAASSSSSSSSSSTAASEQATRTVLHCSSALMHLGLPPAGLAAFCSSAFGSSSGARATTAAAASGAGAGAGSSAADLATSLQVQTGPVSAFSAELLSDALLGLGAQSVVVEEAREPGGGEQEVFGAEGGLWDRCHLLVHFPLEHDVPGTMAAVQDICELPGLQYTVQPVMDQEWVAQIQASYVPVQVAPGLYIIPDHCQPTDAEALNVRLIPGVAFGTGEHPTTKLCLQRLVSLQQALAGARVMDYGAGSGVLAIAALLLGAAAAVGTDTDPLAVRAAAANAALNGLQERLQLLQCGASLSDPDPLLQVQGAGAGAGAGQFDLVMANILRGPLLDLQPRLTAYCRPGGRLLLSGILQAQVPDVQAAYAPFFEGFETDTEGSWAAVTAVRKAQ